MRHVKSIRRGLWLLAGLTAICSTIGSAYSVEIVGAARALLGN